MRERTLRSRCALHVWQYIFTRACCRNLCYVNVRARQVISVVKSRMRPWPGEHIFRAKFSAITPVRRIHYRGPALPRLLLRACVCICLRACVCASFVRIMCLGTRMCGSSQSLCVVFRVSEWFVFVCVCVMCVCVCVRMCTGVVHACVLVCIGRHRARNGKFVGAK